LVLSGCLGISEPAPKPLVALISMDSVGWLNVEFPVCAGDTRPQIYVSDRSLGGTGSVSNYLDGEVVTDSVIRGRISPPTLSDGSLTSDLPRSGFSPFSSMPRDADQAGHLSVEVDGFGASATIADLKLRSGQSVLLTGRLGLGGSSLEAVTQEEGRLV